MEVDVVNWLLFFQLLDKKSTEMKTLTEQEGLHNEMVIRGH